MCLAHILSICFRLRFLALPVADEMYQAKLVPTEYFQLFFYLNICLFYILNFNQIVFSIWLVWMTGVFLRQIWRFGAGWKGRWAAADGFCQLFVMDWQGGCFVANSNKNALYRHSRADGNPGGGFSGLIGKGCYATVWIAACAGMTMAGIFISIHYINQIFRRPLHYSGSSVNAFARKIGTNVNR